MWQSSDSTSHNKETAISALAHLLMGVAKMRNRKQSRKQNGTENLMQYLHYISVKCAILLPIIIIYKKIINMSSVIKKMYGLLIS